MEARDVALLFLLLATIVAGGLIASVTPLALASAILLIRKLLDELFVDLDSSWAKRITNFAKLLNDLAVILAFSLILPIQDYGKYLLWGSYVFFGATLLLDSIAYLLELVKRI